ncbi:hypothetical protein F2Q70_00038386 [Brassica cretica]|uniref:Uncharacterized protein n=1 Tax=Brassica cretica TaxID=69181 RepID=A0A8S9K6Q0_BRACR|nr:hypothetical protein F2Q70_00038386 [Brassica cretica]
MFGFEVIEIENLVLKMLNTAADHDTVPSDIESIEIITGRKRGGKRNTKQTKGKSRKKATPPLEEYHVESLSTGNSDDLSAHENETDHLDQSYGPQGTEAHNKQSSSKSKGVEAPEIAEQSRRSRSSYGDHEVDLL